MVERDEVNSNYDEYDSPAYYQDSAPYAHKLHNFRIERRKPKSVDTTPNLGEAFRLTEKNWALAYEANAEEESYQTLWLPAGQLVWKGQCWDLNGRELQPCYMTRIDGKIFVFHSLMEDDGQLVPVSLARATIMNLGQTLRNNR